MKLSPEKIQELIDQLKLECLDEYVIEVYDFFWAAPGILVVNTSEGYFSWNGSQWDDCSIQQERWNQ